MELQRPRLFEEVIGNNITKDFIQSALSRNKYPNISMITGPSGSGKSTIAEIIATKLLCKDTSGNSEPCLRCDDCIRNIRDLNKGVSNESLKKENMAMLDRKNLTDKVKEIFNLQPLAGSLCVYVLEEFHVLKDNEQELFLEEMSNMADDVYIIICTSKKNSVITAIQGRATQYEMKSPTTDECIDLITKLCVSRNIKPPNKRVMKTSVKRMRNNPREIVKNFTMLIDTNHLDEDSINAYLNVEPIEKFIEFFSCCNESMFKFINFLDSIGSEELIKFYSGLKSFLLDVTTTVFGDNKQQFSLKERQSIINIFEKFNERDFMNFLNYFDRGYLADDIAIKYFLIGVKRFFNQEDVKTVCVNSVKKAKLDEINSINKTKEIVIQKSNNDNKSGKAVEMEDITDVLGVIQSIKRD